MTLQAGPISAEGLYGLWFGDVPSRNEWGPADTARIAALKEWGEAQYEAGRASQREELAVRCERCHEPLGEDYRTHECLFDAPATAPEPGVDTPLAPLNFDPRNTRPPAPESLVETTRALGRALLVPGNLEIDVMAHLAEAIDALAARVGQLQGDVIDDLGILYAKVAALEAELRTLDALVGDVSVVERIGRAHRNDPDHDTGGPG